MKILITYCLLIITTPLNIGCKHKKVESPQLHTLLKKEKSAGADKLQKGPIINISDTTEVTQIVLAVKDSAATSAGMSIKLNNIYNKVLPEAARAGNVKITGQPMVWYNTQKAFYIFEAGVPVDKAPAKTIKGIKIKRTGADSALVAHFFGPYELTAAGYEALYYMLKERHKKRASPAYEIYIKNPFAPTNEKTDPYKWQTDIVMPYK